MCLTQHRPQATFRLVNNQGKINAPQPAERNPAEYAILGGLAEGPAHGYDLYQQLSQELAPVWNLGQSQVYGLLKRLAEDGLVEHERVDQASRPAKNIFRLAPLGRGALEKWAVTPVDHVRQLRLEFLAKLHFAGRLSSQARAELVAAQKEACRQMAEGLAARLEEASNPMARRAFSYRLAVARAALTWLEECVESGEPPPEKL